ncbi:hypothetical protein [Hungatella hathewayi]|uniref:hypothetical protein n=1 Tax=Hungatella hathewayi TaxID=154046 RepID=UPI0026DAACC5|nr:hypothetical protein [Hungatella hathewayi]
MKTRGDVIDEYEAAFKNETQGKVLLKRMNFLNSLNCSDHEKALCLKQEIDHIICGFMKSNAN